MTAESEQAPRLRRSWPQRLLLAFGVVAVLATLAGAAGVAYLGRAYDKVEKYDVALTPTAPGEPANFLIVGSDSREGVAEDDPISGAFTDGASSGRRSDTLLVVRVDPEEQTATMLSLPRDLWVPMADTGDHQRINAAYARGKQVLTDTIEQSLGIPINHYVEVDFQGFAGVVNAIGGVPMYFERAMKDTNSGLDVLHPGCITLDGTSGLAFARSRHLEFMLDGVWRSDPTGDLGRITRQQLFVRRAISQAVSQGLTNPLTLTRLVDVGVKNVGIDDGLSPSALADLGRTFAKFRGEELETQTLPVTPFISDGGADVLLLDEAAAVPILDLFRSEPAGAPEAAAPVAVEGPADVSVRVLNGSNTDGRATNVAGALQGAGFRIVGKGNVAEIGGTAVDHSVIHHAPGHEAAAQLLARHLEGGADLVADDTAAGAVILVVGRDFTAVTAQPSPAPPTTTTPPGPSTTTTSTTTTTTAPAATTTTEPVGRTPGETPPGVSCG